MIYLVAPFSPPFQVILPNTNIQRPDKRTVGEDQSVLLDGGRRFRSYRKHVRAWQQLRIFMNEEMIIFNKFLLFVRIPYLCASTQAFISMDIYHHFPFHSILIQTSILLGCTAFVMSLEEILIYQHHKLAKYGGNSPPLKRTLIVSTRTNRTVYIEFKIGQTLHKTSLNAIRLWFNCSLIPMDKANVLHRVIIANDCSARGAESGNERKKARKKEERRFQVLWIGVYMWPFLLIMDLYPALCTVYYTEPTVNRNSQHQVEVVTWVWKDYAIE
ncbi:hypothetical protein F2P81_013518 [Scophthalmus maximus]|uniref:Uncharacterized protein n=1 Tax=Scophthalmus maximus TaxID=52904 RepID=A0A6A4STL5_SCOMX|nr:hypothetical protein F2P81_013518 [Scophthalmus maximus]